MMMGRARLWQASIRNVERDRPCSRCAMMAYSTSRMEFLVDTPISIAKPNEGGHGRASCRDQTGQERAAKRYQDHGRDDGDGCRKSLNSSTSTM